MSDNNPFDRPPMQPSAPPPVSADWGPTTPFNPIGPRHSGPGRVKIAALALGAAALTGGAIFGISKFADADDATLAESEASVPAATAPVFSPGSENTGNENIGGENTGGDAAPTPSIPDVFAGIGECIDIDEILESMGAGGAGTVTMGSVPSLDFTTIGEVVGDTVTITSADGVTVYTLGDGDASIAISKSGGAITVAASGDATESSIVNFADLEAQMNDMMGELEEMHLDDMPAVSLPADFDPAEIRACIENLDVGGGG